MANGKLSFSFDWKRDGKKLILLVILLLVLAIVWIRVFSINGLFGGAKKNTIKPKTTPESIINIPKKEEVSMEELLSKPLFSYRNPFSLTAKRNPFSPPFAVASAKEVEDIVVTPSITLPSDIVLTGIVKTGSEVFAIIEGLDIKDVVQEGDTILDSFIVERIDTNNKRVILKNGGKRFILELRGEEYER